MRSTADLHKSEKHAETFLSNSMKVTPEDCLTDTPAVMGQNISSPQSPPPKLSMALHLNDSAMDRDVTIRKQLNLSCIPSASASAECSKIVRPNSLKEVRSSYTEKTLVDFCDLQKNKHKLSKTDSPFSDPNELAFKNSNKAQLIPNEPHISDFKSHIPKNFNTSKQDSNRRVLVQPAKSQTNEASSCNSQLDEVIQCITEELELLKTTAVQVNMQPPDSLVQKRSSVRTNRLKKPHARVQFANFNHYDDCDFKTVAQHKSSELHQSEKCGNLKDQFNVMVKKRSRFVDNHPAHCVSSQFLAHEAKDRCDHFSSKPYGSIEYMPSHLADCIDQPNSYEAKDCSSNSANCLIGKTDQSDHSCANMTLANVLLRPQTDLQAFSQEQRPQMQIFCCSGYFCMNNTVAMPNMEHVAFLEPTLYSTNCQPQIHLNQSSNSLQCLEDKLINTPNTSRTQVDLTISTTKCQPHDQQPKKERTPKYATQCAQCTSSNTVHESNINDYIPKLKSIYQKQAQKLVAKSCGKPMESSPPFASMNDTTRLNYRKLKSFYASEWKRFCIPGEDYHLKERRAVQKRCSEIRNRSQKLKPSNSCPKWVN